MTTIRWLWWHLWVKRQIRSEYEREGAIYAAAWLDAYGYADGLEESLPMVRWLAKKNGWEATNDNQ